MQKSVGGVGSVWPLSVAAGSGTGRASPKRSCATGEGTSDAGPACVSRAGTGRGPDRVPRRWKASRIGNPPFFNQGGGGNGLGRRNRVSVVRRTGSIRTATGRQNPALARARGVDNARWAGGIAGRSGLGGVETPGPVAARGFTAGARHSLWSAWVLVFENVGCISRPDTSWSFRDS